MVREFSVFELLWPGPAEEKRVSFFGWANRPTCSTATVIYQFFVMRLHGLEGYGQIAHENAGDS